MSVGGNDRTNEMLQRLIEATEEQRRETEENTRALRELARTQPGGGAGGRVGFERSFAGRGLGGVAGSAAFNAAGGGLLGTVAGSAAGGIVGGVAKAAGKGLKDFGLGVAQDAINFGTDFAGKGVAGQAVRAGSRLPLIGDVFDQAQAPLEAAAGRVLGITGAIARAGGQVTQELRQQLAGQFLPQELRAKKEELAVARFFKSPGTVAFAAQQSGSDLVQGTVNAALVLTTGRTINETIQNSGWAQHR